MRRGLVLASVVMVCSGAVLAHTSGDPAPAVAAPVVVKQELTLRKLSRQHDSLSRRRTRFESGEIDFQFYATGFESEWVSWSKSPDITRLTDKDGKSLLPPADPGVRPTSGGTVGNWGTERSGSFQSVSVRINNDQIDRFGVLDAVAEIEVAKDLEYMDLGELKGLDTQIELAAGVVLWFKADIREKSFGFNADILYEDKHGTPARLVGLETFDSEGKPSQKLGWSGTGFPGSYHYRDGRPMPHTGRLVFAKRTERIPLRFTGKDVAFSGMSLRDVDTITVEAMQQTLKAKEPSADELSELFISSVRLGREDLANLLIEADAPVNGQLFVVLDAPEGKLSRADSKAMRERLFRRHIEKAGQTKNLKALEDALALSLLGTGSKFIPEILKWNPPLIKKDERGSSHLTTMFLFGVFVPEIADAYAKEVLTRGPDFEFASRDDFTEFLAAAYMGDHARLTAMIKAGTDINQHPELGWNALGWACVSPHTTMETVKLLLDAGVPIDDGNKEGQTALLPALYGKRYDYAVDLIQRGVLKQLTSRRWIPRAFQLSGASGSSELVKAIFDNLPPTNTEAASAILMSAATSGNDEIVRITMQWIRQSQIDPKRQKQMIDWVAADVAREGKPETLKILKDEGPK